MKLYSIKSCEGQISYCSILSETDNGYLLRICRDIDGYEKVSEDFIEKPLFELCIRTGYIREVSKNMNVFA